MNHQQSGLQVGVLGATGLVGREILRVLDARQFPYQQLHAFARPNHRGEQLETARGHVSCRIMTPQDWQQLDILFLACPPEVSADIAPKAAAAGVLVIDNSDAFRADAQIPLIVPEVNANVLKSYQGRLLANPNCTVIQLSVALAPLHRQANCSLLVVASYQAVSGAGADAQDELATQLQALFTGNTIVTQELPRQIASNCIPQIGILREDGNSSEEHKVITETRKILNAPHLAISATCVRVPVFVGHSLAVFAQFEQLLPKNQAQTILQNSPGIVLCGSANLPDYPTPVDVLESEATWVGRLRQPDNNLHVLQFFCVADNLCKGAAGNAVQIAEIALQQSHLCAAG